MKFLLINGLLFIALSFTGCKKVEGEGGSSIIKGFIQGQDYNAIDVLISEYPLAKEDVYIIYGESSNFYDDKIETSYDGTFEFRYLQPGKYKVFYYEKCTSCESGKKAVVTEVEVVDKKSTVDMGQLNARQ